MTDAQQAILPKALYVDTNALLALPDSLATEPMAEVVDLANRLAMGLFVPQLCVDEWTSHRTADAVKVMNRILGDAKRIGSLLDRSALECEAIPMDDLCRSVRDNLIQRLNSIGFQTIPTPDVELSKLLEMFVAKEPPFGDGDKGFKDAVILESILHHSSEANSFDHIMFLTSDKRFAHPAIGKRFADVGVALRLIGGERLLSSASTALKESLDTAAKDLMVQTWERATDFARQHEAEIFDFVLKNATLSMSLLKGYARGHERDENDKKLDYSRIESIGTARPTAIVSAFPMPSSSHERSDGRTSFVITVEIEIDVTILWPNVFAEPRVAIENASALVEEQGSWHRPEREETLTLKREVTVHASVASIDVAACQLTDLHLEEVY